jgi:hypothetical protein
MNCPQCGQSEMVAKQTASAVSVGGILGALVLLAGVVLLLASPIVGLLTILVGIAIGMAGRRQITRVICPACRHSIKL